MVDPIKRSALIRTIQSQPEFAEGRALVTIAEFFDGNDDLGSIGCNLSEHPGLDHFKKILSDLEKRSEVEQVWMQIYDLEEGEWPFSENILIVGEIPLSDVRRLSESLQPSEISDLQVDWTPTRAKTLHGRRYINLWWD
jgi:hypothetical protein